MWPFNRNKKSTNSLKEKVSPSAVKEYYQAGGNRQGWVVWLLSIAAFLITLIIVLSLFWAGRWTWQKIRNSNNKSAPATQQGQSDQEQGAQSQPEAGSGAGSANNTPQPSPTPQTTPTPAPAPVPATGDQAGHLPNTGPTSDE